MDWGCCEGLVVVLLACRYRTMGHGLCLSMPDLPQQRAAGGEGAGLSGSLESFFLKRSEERMGNRQPKSGMAAKRRLPPWQTLPRISKSMRTTGAAPVTPPPALEEDEEGSPHTRLRAPSVVVSDFSNEGAEAGEAAEEGGVDTPPGWGWLGTPPPRKASSCSTCSTLSDDEYTPTRLLEPLPTKKPSGWRKLRNIVQWTPFFQTYKKQRYPWVQLAGHQGNFRAGPEPGTILKKLCPKEQLCFQSLMRDVLRPYVPQYRGHVTCEEAMFLQLQDLLGEFTNPCVMDCKVGVRTYLEEELAKAKENPKLRKDMYEKMVQIDSNAPTDEEHRLKGVTKPRYMVWRETISSTATLGFRIEGVKKSDGKSSKDFKTTKTREQIIEAFTDFTQGFPHAVPKYIQRLKAIKATLEVSTFFNTHEMIGSSLLFVHDENLANVWLIDFAKTIVLPGEVSIDHLSPWVVGNHEDGYLLGINNLIDIFSKMAEGSSDDRRNTTTLLVNPPPQEEISPPSS